MPCIQNHWNCQVTIFIKSSNQLDLRIETIHRGIAILVPGMMIICRVLIILLYSSSYPLSNSRKCICFGIGVKVKLSEYSHFSQHLNYWVGAPLGQPTHVQHMAANSFPVSQSSNQASIFDLPNNKKENTPPTIRKPNKHPQKQLLLLLLLSSSDRSHSLWQTWTCLELEQQQQNRSCCFLPL